MIVKVIEGYVQSRGHMDKEFVGVALDEKGAEEQIKKARERSFYRYFEVCDWDAEKGEYPEDTYAKRYGG